MTERCNQSISSSTQSIIELKKCQLKSTHTHRVYEAWEKKEKKNIRGNLASIASKQPDLFLKFYVQVQPLEQITAWIRPEVDLSPDPTLHARQPGSNIQIKVSADVDSNFGIQVFWVPLMAASAMT